jgi:nucleoporin POM152
LGSRDYVIDVRRDRPLAFFSSDDKQDKTVFMAEGEQTKLPLRLTGEGPWEVSYRHVDGKKEQTKTITLTDPNTQLTVSKVGRYELTNVEDSICTGDVLRPDYIVQWMERPALTLAEDQATLISDNHLYQRASVCQNVDDAIDVELTGHGPFTCTYDTYLQSAPSSSIISVFGRRDQGVKLEPQEMTTGSTRTRVSLRTDMPGKYKYSFNKLSDQRYQAPFTPSPLIQLEQTVHASPTVRFAGKSAASVRTMCVGESLSPAEDPIWIETTGQAPFTITLRIIQQDSKKTIELETMESTRFAMDLPDVLEVSGKYRAELVRVQDANGCGSEVTGQPNTVMTIDALGIATITPLGACGEVCVGDQLEYSLSGEGPFTVGKCLCVCGDKNNGLLTRILLLPSR